MKLRYLLFLALLIPAALLLCSRGAVPSFSGTAAALTFVIDAGQGGEDGGALSADGWKESDFNLAIARRLDLLLGLCGLPAVMTREDDHIAYPEGAHTIRQRKFADMEYRAALVNSREHPVLVSIHQNKYSTPGPKGAQVFYGKSAGSREFALCMQGYLAVLCGDHRKTAPISEEIYLLREAICPAVLVECGFLSNPEELSLLKTDEYQTKLAAALAAGCLEHLKDLESIYGEG